MIGDKGALFSRYGGVIIKGLIMSSVFFLMPKTATGLFSRGGFLFFSLTFNTLICQSELATFMQGRGILEKHKSFALYRPSFFYVAQVVADIPLAFIQVIIFQICVYFMSGLALTAGQVCLFTRLYRITWLWLTYRIKVLHVYDQLGLCQSGYERLLPHVWQYLAKLLCRLAVVQLCSDRLPDLLWLLDSVHADAPLAHVDLLDQSYGVRVQGHHFQRTARQLFLLRRRWQLHPCWSVLHRSCLQDLLCARC